MADEFYSVLCMSLNMTSLQHHLPCICLLSGYILFSLESRRPQPAESVSLSENVLTSEFVAMSEPAIPSESFTPSEFVTRSENVPTSEPVPLSESVTPLELMKPSESVPLVESFPLNESTFITSEIVLPDQSESVTPESASIEQSKVVKATNSDQSPLGWCLCCSLSGCWKCCK